MAEQKAITRRRFFAGLGLAAAAGAAVKIAAPVASVASAPPEPAEPEGDSYRLTEHVKKYYRTTTL
jgi:hypothetical protein